MRNPFKRVAAPETARPTLRERLSATKAKARQVLAVNAVIARKPSPAPAVDRIALVNYASWLCMERRMVCMELYPHMGERADRFVIAANAADRFHYPTAGGFPSGITTAPKPSTRAVQVLDMVGVDWRADLGNGANLDPPAMRDDGQRPVVSHGWPRLDAALLDAFDDLTRLDAAQLAMGKAGLCAARNADTVPGYDGLEAARDDALVRVCGTRAESLTGLQVKAKAILTESVADIYEDARSIGRSLAEDILGATNRTIEPRPDPILGMIAEGRRLLREVDAAYAASPDADDDDPRFRARNDLMRQMWSHIDGVVLKTVPQTAAGCRELARFEVEFFDSQGVTISNDERAIVGLIAASPLL